MLPDLIRRSGRYLALLLLLLGVQQLLAAGMIQAKAALAPLLIADAWQDSLTGDGQARPPWPWADTWPVARLQVPALGVDQYVLAGSSGQALAFGPGLDAAGVIPGAPGIAVIAGHRDTHFAFLARLRPGMLIRIQSADGHWTNYEAGRARVVDNRAALAAPRHGGDAELELVTCYPFDALNSGGPLRYVFSAHPVSGVHPPQHNVTGGYRL